MTVTAASRTIHVTAAPTTSGATASASTPSTTKSIQFETTSKSKDIRRALQAAQLFPATTAADLTAEDVVVRLYTSDGSALVPLGPNIPSNTSETAYHVQWKKVVQAAVAEAKVESAADLNKELQGLNDKIFNLKTRMLSLESRKTANLQKWEKIQPAINRVQVALNSTDLSSIDYTKQSFKPETLAELKKPTFDVWKWQEIEIIRLLEEILKEFGLTKTFGIDDACLRRFLCLVRTSYNENPFHNFRHCFCVTQMCYAILHESKIHEKLTDLEKFALIIGCIGHDLDHPGSNNAYQINAGTAIATVYNDTSPLESHHAAVLFAIMREGQYNIASGLPESKYKDFRKDAINCILATDMAKHGDIVTKFKAITETFSYEDESHRKLLMQIVIKCADISNEVRPQHMADNWVNGLLDEFFSQFGKEKEQGLPTAPFMDPSKVTKPAAQIGFIGFVMIPLFESLSKLVPVIEPTIVQPIQDSLLYYKDLQSKAQAASAPSTAPATAAPAPAVVAPAPAAQPQQRQPAAPKK